MPRGGVCVCRKERAGEEGGEDAAVEHSLVGGAPARALAADVGGHMLVVGVFYATGVMQGGASYGSASFAARVALRARTAR